MTTDLTPGTVTLPHGDFDATAVPDVFDARDLEYRPRLQPLAHELECRPADRFVMSQEGSSCTGHAVAAMVNSVLRTEDDATHVSPYMLYALARRYDEFPGEADVGSSLRGALKGWYYHGVLPESRWPTITMQHEPDLDLDEEVATLASRLPLGAFYRVNASRLDDLQSAIQELSAIAVSASIHDGWNEPVVMTRTVDGTPQAMHVITRTSASRAIGGHAFCLVGYNEVGFLVQNSWGSQWGHQGFATLPYDDWLESGYDAWVARPGVPSVVSARTRKKVFSLSGGGLVDAPGPDLALLADHVVNLGNNGRLSTSGRFKSSKSQVDKVFGHMRTCHDAWGASPRRIMLYAHGGLNSEKTGLAVAQRQVNWWLANQVYPVSFAWQTGLAETLLDEISDFFGAGQPAGGLPFNLIEQLDRQTEKRVRSRLHWIWGEMKENASKAADPLPESWESAADEQLPGISLVVDRLAGYLAEPSDVPVEVHLVGHSAGSIFLVGLLEALVAEGIPVASMTYLAAALRTDEWMQRVLPHLRSSALQRFTAFGMSPQRELNDTVGASGLALYHKSLLYLVSRGFERPADPSEREVPLVGMAHFAKADLGGTTFEKAVEQVHGDLVWSACAAPAQSCSESTSHGGFDDDSPTMTSVLLRILGRQTRGPGNEYIANLPPPEIHPVVVSDPTAVDDQPPDMVTTEVHGSGQGPFGAAAAGPVQATTTSSPARGTGATADRDSRVLAAMSRDGWARAVTTS